MRIPPLEELPLWVRSCILIAILVLVLLFLWLVFVLDEQEAAAAEPVQISKYEARILQLEQEALDEAFKKHLIRLYDIWVTDYTPEMPPRAIKGAHNARDAYERYMMAVERRKKILDERNRNP